MSADSERDTQLETWSSVGLEDLAEPEPILKQVKLIVKKFNDVQKGERKVINRTESDLNYFEHAKFQSALLHIRNTTPKMIQAVANALKEENILDGFLHLIELSDRKQWTDIMTGKATIYWDPCLLVLEILVKFTRANSNFSRALAQHNLLKSLINLLNRKQSGQLRRTNSKADVRAVTEIMHIIENSSFGKSNIPYLRSAFAIQACLPYIDRSLPVYLNLQIPALNTISNIIDDDEGYSDLKLHICDWLNHVLRCAQRLKKKAVQYGGCDIDTLFRVGLRHTWKFCFDEPISRDISDCSGWASLLDKLLDHPRDDISEAARGILWKSKDEEQFLNFSHLQNESETSFGHIYINYAHSPKTRMKVKKICNEITEKGMNVWIDSEQNMEYLYPKRMAEAIEKAALILICACKDYKDCLKCRTEAFYAVQIKKPMIFVVLDKFFTAEGWIDQALSDNVTSVHDFSDSSNLELQTKELIAVLNEMFPQESENFDVPESTRS